MIFQKEIVLKSRSRGYHIISSEIIENIPEMPETGLAHIFIKHTSAGLMLNENADPSVRIDFEKIMNKIVPENEPYYTHTAEGSDDMPSHVKSGLLGSSLTIPISSARFNLGTWQGIYLCEFRNYGGRRKIIITIYS